MTELEKRIIEERARDRIMEELMGDMSGSEVSEGSENVDRLNYMEESCGSEVSIET